MDGLHAAGLLVPVEEAEATPVIFANYAGVDVPMLPVVAGARAIVHSDDAGGIQRLNQEAAKAVLSGRQAGIQVSDDEVNRNPRSRSARLRAARRI